MCLFVFSLRSFNFLFTFSLRSNISFYVSSLRLLIIFTIFKKFIIDISSSTQVFRSLVVELAFDGESVCLAVSL
jgi:hypothetical protein